MTTARRVFLVTACAIPVLAGVVLGADAYAVTGTAAGTAPLPGPDVGRWDAAVVTAAGTTEPVGLHFTPNGSLVVTAPDGTFTGRWTSIGPGTFTFWFTRTLPVDGGEVVGSITVRHTATFSGPNAFSSTGTAVGHDPAGGRLFSATVSSTATRA